MRPAHFHQRRPDPDEPAVWVWGLSAGDYLLMVASLGCWVYLGARWLRGQERPASLGMWVLWLLWAAFALQGMEAGWTQSLERPVSHGRPRGG